MHAAEVARSGTLADFIDLDHGSGLVVVVAHPDDETIGLGGHLAQVPNVTIVHVTDGAPRDLADARANGFDDWQSYALARRSELERAMAEAGIGTDGLISLHVPDKQAAYQMAAMANSLTRLFAKSRARIVFTHPYEGGHPDHDATAFAVDAACRILVRTGERPPLRVEMACYHAGANGPVFQDFPPDPMSRTVEIELSSEALQMKRRMIGHHVTQRDTLAPFTATVERLRLAPAYNFRALPNAGRLYYETLPVGFGGADWPPLVDSALRDLGLDGK
jgi:LmbE family N-acetylglucosaminyl deacetylase